MTVPLARRTGRMPEGNCLNRLSIEDTELNQRQIKAAQNPPTDQIRRLLQAATTTLETALRDGWPTDSTYLCPSPSLGSFRQCQRQQFAVTASIRDESRATKLICRSFLRIFYPALRHQADIVNANYYHRRSSGLVVGYVTINLAG